MALTNRRLAIIRLTRNGRHLTSIPVRHVESFDTRFRDERWTVEGFENLPKGPPADQAVAAHPQRAATRQFAGIREFVLHRTAKDSSRHITQLLFPYSSWYRE